MVGPWKLLMEKVRAMRSPSPKTNSTEPMKPVLSNGLWEILSWHVWTVISVAVSAILIYLNLTNYAIGGEIGENAAATANILGALQLAIKAHELAMVASLVSIAREWILGNLMDVNNGMLLGLVGAEGSLGAPSFLISGQYLAATQYALSGALWWRQSTPEETARKRGILKLAAFMCIGCIVCALAGPASGVLMIPRVDWFFGKTITVPIRFKFPWTNHYPNIMIDERYGRGSYRPFYTQGPFGVEGFDNLDYFMQYWHDYASRRVLLLRVHESELTHTVSDLYGEIAINTSTTWDRTLGGSWRGGTTARTTMRAGIILIFASLHSSVNGTTRESDNYEAALAKWSARQYVAESGAVAVQTECHYRLKAPCVPSNSSDWCYTSRSQDGSVIIKSSRDLLLMGQGSTDTQKGVSIYITEGPMLTNYTDFASSLEVVIDEKNQRPGDLATSNSPAVTVCSISARFLSATISTADIVFTGNIADYHEYQVLADGTHEPAVPAIYHKHWLDSLDLMKVGDHLASDPVETATGNVTFSRRNSSRITSSPVLKRIATALMPFSVVQDEAGSFTWVNSTMEAAELEVILSGIFASHFLFIPYAESQYMVSEGMTMAGTWMPRQRLYNPVEEMKVHVYNQGYGFRLSTRTGRLGIAVLFCHISIALWGSLWQLFRWKVTAGWGTIPDYLALGLGSPLDQMGLDNTCAGISSKRTFQTIVRVGARTPTHLEIAVLEPTAPAAVGVDAKPRLTSSLATLESARLAVEYGSRKRSGGRKGESE